jgi:TRAP-type C4-dicarboxylate transport system permease large subunit
VEIGLLTPPFGMVAFAMKAALPDDVKIEEIFHGCFPFYSALLVSLGLIIAFPEISNFLPRVLSG